MNKKQRSTKLMGVAHTSTTAFAQCSLLKVGRVEGIIPPTEFITPSEEEAFSHGRIKMKKPGFFA